jgi:Capsule assembly protein Wzi
VLWFKVAPFSTCARTPYYSVRIPINRSSLSFPGRSGVKARALPQFGTPFNCHRTINFARCRTNVRDPQAIDLRLVLKSPPVPGRGLRDDRLSLLSEVRFKRSNGDLKCLLLQFSVTSSRFGQQSLWWGVNRGTSLLLPNNAEAMPIIRLDCVSPLKLPGPLKILGPFYVSGFLAIVRGTEDLSSGLDFVPYGDRRVLRPRLRKAEFLSKTILGIDYRFRLGLTDSKYTIDSYACRNISARGGRHSR